MLGFAAFVELEDFADALSVDTLAGCSYALAMEVHFSPEQEAELSQIATRAGTDAERLVQGAALRLVEEAAQFRAAVREGIAAADRGDFVEDDEVLRWLQGRQGS